MAGLITLNADDSGAHHPITPLCELDHLPPFRRTGKLALCKWINGLYPIRMIRLWPESISASNDVMDLVYQYDSLG